MKSTAKIVTPRVWNESFSSRPVLSSETRRLRGAVLRRWTGIAAEMRQPVLDHHYLVLHLGGPKRIRRSGEGAPVTVDVNMGAQSMVPMGSSYQWVTSGAIDFAHLYLSPGSVKQCVHEAFDRESSTVELIDRVGFDDELIRTLMITMMEDISTNQSGSNLYLQTLLDTILARLVRNHSTLHLLTPCAKQTLAPHKLSNVRDFIEENLTQELDLETLADSAGLSRFHFSRVFQRTTGCSPYRYVTLRRLDRAKKFMCETSLSLAEIAGEAGFASAAQFSTIFRKFVGSSPREWRRQR